MDSREACALPSPPFGCTLFDGQRCSDRLAQLMLYMGKDEEGCTPSWFVTYASSTGTLSLVKDTTVAQYQCDPALAAAEALRTSSALLSNQFRAVSGRAAAFDLKRVSLKAVG